MTPAEREALITETLPLIKHIAHRVATRLPSNIELQDLINAGVLGLLAPRPMRARLAAGKTFFSSHRHRIRQPPVRLGLLAPEQAA